MEKRPVIYLLLGGSGDLSSRFLIPSLYQLWKKEILPKSFLIVGAGLILWSNNQYRQKILEQMIERGFVKPDDWDEFAEHLEWHYLNLDENDLPGYLRLKQRLVSFDDLYGDSLWIYYCAIPPKFFSPVLEFLGKAQMLEKIGKQVIALEKPIATDPISAQKLIDTINQYCKPEQVVCVEHFALKPMAKAMKKFLETDSILDSFQPQSLKAIDVVAYETITVPPERTAFYNACPATLDMHSHLLIPMTAQVVLGLEQRSRFIS